jgi:anaerobic selenocysteine-containing dehydrogenase
MSDIAAALSDGRLKVLLLLGTNMLSSFADAGHVADGLDKTELVVCVDLFMNETARRFADVVLPGTAWLEELGFKVTNTHLYLMERALEREGETRPIYEILRSLASSLGLADFFPWASMEEVLDAILDHPTTGDATVASLRAADGFLPLKVPHVAYVGRNFESPSGKIEFYSSQANTLGLPPLPVHKVDKGSPVSVGPEFRKNTNALSFILRRGESSAVVGKTQYCASTLDIQGRRSRANSYSAVTQSRFTMSGESLGQRRMSPTTCHQVWSGFAMGGSGSIISHLAMRF